ncbi:MAG: hypothetical protein V3R57_02825 [Candidatus Bathyarchaeia archaeon]|jgi:hypothetical protein
MSEPSMMDRVFNYVTLNFVEKGRAPYFLDIAKEFSVPPEDGKKLLHELMATGVPAWLFPGTDDIVSFAPFHNLPNQYRISVEGEQKWYAQ